VGALAYNQLDLSWSRSDEFWRPSTLNAQQASMGERTRSCAILNNLAEQSRDTVRFRGQFVVRPQEAP
jgi:hypothetical protein